MENTFNPVLKTEAIEIDTLLGVARIPGFRDVYITPKEMQILAYLLLNKGVVCTRDYIIRHFWQGATVHERTVDAHICYIRKKLPEEISSRIQIVAGEGYVYN